MEKNSIAEILINSFGFALGLALLAIAVGVYSRPVYAIPLALVGIVSVSIFGRSIHKSFSVIKKPQA